TGRVIGDRRLGALRELSVRLSTSQTTDGVWLALTESLRDSKDIPFALAYTVEGDAATLCASANVPRGHLALRPSIGMNDRQWPIGPVAAGASSGDVVPLRPDVAWPTGPWQNTPQQAMVLPIGEPGQARPAGVLIAGLNPYRPLDTEYRSF